MFNSSIPKKGALYTPEDSVFLMDDPKKNYTRQFQKILRGKVAKITAPILIVQGSGQSHCFCIGSGLPRPSRRPTQASAPGAALQAFHDIDAFCRKYLRTQPKEIDRQFVTQVPVPIEWPPAA